ncbi:MAG TPA: tRNA (adenosine(37)-N6)-threonylcarbamoyltransferase complex ATPase subunit type 1 TsaE [Acidobacteriota bacterium]|nr:tRNA (adenosine(37)-N6)-threonylcarbamoyltransferase complex ATPase subunit type 1 TsaE [Acidobacteriota bacterium]
MSRYSTRDEEETRRLGTRLAKKLSRPALVLLRGELGAGKTVLAKGLAQGFGVEDASVVHSPTFSLINLYPSPGGPVYHVDLYRLESQREQYSTGLDEVLCEEQAAVIIEWAEKLSLAARPSLSIEIVSGEDETRLIQVEECR